METLWSRPKAHVKRVEPANMPGWFGIAVSFDDFAFDRDDNIPGRFLLLTDNYFST